MLRVNLLLSLAVTVLATTGTYTGIAPQVVRLGSVGSFYSYLNGVLVPYTKYVSEGIPAFELRQLVKGAAQTEENLYNFRCSYIDNSLLPPDAADKPVYVCRNLNWEKGSAASSDEKITFMFYASELKMTPAAEIDLWIGKSLTHGLVKGAFNRVFDKSMGNVIRFGSIGTKFANINSYVVPHTKTVTEGVPAIEIRTIVDGVAKEEDVQQLFNFRCGLMENYYVPVETSSKPVYICRHISHDTAVPSDRKLFLFTADSLNVAPGTKMIDLWFGKSLWTNFISDVYATPSILRDEVTEHVIRLGSIGTRFAGLKGILVPYTKVVTEGVPSLELRSVIKGVPVVEQEHINFRCARLDEYYVPLETFTKPVFLCRGVGVVKSDTGLADKNVFLFSPETFPPSDKLFDLWLGKTLWNDFTSDVYPTMN